MSLKTLLSSHTVKMLVMGIVVAFIGIALRLFGITAGLPVTLAGFLIIAGALGGIMLGVSRRVSQWSERLEEFESSSRWFSTEILNHEASIFRRIRRWDETGVPVAVPHTQKPDSAPKQSSSSTGVAKAQSVTRISEVPKLESSRRDLVQVDAVKSPQDLGAAWLVEHELIADRFSVLEPSHYIRTPEKPFVKDVRVAMIADEFTYSSFEPEFSTVALAPSTWREQLDKFEPDVLFVESAWAGIPSKAAPWKGQIYASARFNYENRRTLLDLIAEAKRRSIPTVFWNKEDPTHLNDRVNDFVSTATKFDYILTTAEESVDGYARFHDRDSIEVLQFAAAPKIFNPLGAGKDRENAIVFAGSWYTAHEQRGREMAQIFDSFIDSGIPVVMHDRYYNNPSEYFRVPEKYVGLTRPAVPYRQTAELYRRYNFALNINTVTTSSTMFARRVFEIAACGGHIVSNASPGVKRLLGENVTWSENLHNIQYDAEIFEKSVNAMNIVLASHTYRHRAQQILDVAGISYTAMDKTTLVGKARSKAQAESLVSLAKKCNSCVANVVIIVDQVVPSHEVQTFYREFGGYGAIVVSEEYWRERRIKTSTVLETETWFRVDVDNLPSASEVVRAFSHSQYYSNPIVLSPNLQMPEIKFGDAPKSGLFPASMLEPIVLDEVSFVEYLEV